MDSKDVGAGALFIAVGTFYGGMSLLQLRIGTAYHMGPGYFPLVLSIILIGIGLVVLIPALVRGPAPTYGAVPWRGIAAIASAIVIFGALHRELGMFPVVFVATFVACLSSPQITWFRAVLTSLGASAFCSLTFAFGLGLPIPLIGPWLKFGGM